MTADPMTGWASPPAYGERVPTGALTELVSSIWVRSAASAVEPVRYRDIPDGQAETRCVIGGEPEIVGPRTVPRSGWLDPGEVMVGLRFRPGAAAGLGVPVTELTELSVAVRDLFGAPTSAVPAAAGPDEAISRLAALLLDRPRRDRTDAIVDEAIARLVMQHEVASIRTALGVSERSFRRRFHAATGLAPKTFQRLTRFQRLLRRAQAAAVAGKPVAEHGLAALAVDAGYADQAHLTRECSTITGLSPRVYFAALQVGCRDHDHRAPLPG